MRSNRGRRWNRARWSRVRVGIFCECRMAGKSWQPLSNRSGEPFTPRSYIEHKRAEGKTIDQIFSQDPHCRNSQISTFAYIIIGKHWLARVCFRPFAISKHHDDPSFVLPSRRRTSKSLHESLDFLFFIPFLLPRQNYENSCTRQLARRRRINRQFSCISGSRRKERNDQFFEWH